MNKTLLNHFTVITPLQHGSGSQINPYEDTLPFLLRDLKLELLQAEHELLSPRPEAIEQLLRKALN